MVEQPPQFRIEHLQNYIQLVTLITGDVPKEIIVSQAFFNWYREIVKRQATIFNIQNVNLKDEDMRFNNVKVVAK